MNQEDYMNFKQLATLGFTAVLHMAASNAMAAPALSSFDSPAVFFGQEHSLGYAFTANQNLTVSSLGYYDSDRDGLTADHYVGIYDANHSLLGSATVGGAATLLGDFRYTDLNSTFQLLAGGTYYIAGTTAGFSDGWVYQATNIVTNGITYSGSYFHASTTALTFPETHASGREYMTVNFNVTAVPEPETYAMLLAGLGLVGAIARRRKTA